MPTGAELLAESLARHGLTHVFGLPGTQTVPLFEGLRRSTLRTVLATHELNAAFMAVGFYRASGRPAALASIPGPGFTHALSGVVEARHDSAAMLHLVGPPSTGPGRRFRLQAVDQAAIARLETKGVFEVASCEDIDDVTGRALACATGAEPGPVVLHLPQQVLLAAGSRSTPAQPLPSRECSPAEIGDVAEFVARARRPVLMVGQGTTHASDAIVQLAEALRAPVLSSCSGRGVVPEDHVLALGFDVCRDSIDSLNELLAGADCLLVLGCKLSHNGTGGFRMRLPPDVLVHIDADPGVLGANYPASRAVVADAGSAARAIHHRLKNGAASEWSPGQIQAWRERLSLAPSDDTPEPHVLGAASMTPREFFRGLRRALPRDAIVVTDSGMHQLLVRRHYPVLAPRGLIVPSDYQSMGFGIPAAIGATLGAPQRPVVAVVGDGGFAMAGMELLTAVRERLPLTVIVFNDGYLNLIRMQQHGAWGRSAAVRLRNPDFELLANAIGARYRLFRDDECLEISRGRDAEVTLLEVRLGDSAAMLAHRAQGMARATMRRAIGPRLVHTLKRWMRRPG